MDVCTIPHFLDVPDDFATQSLLHVGEATGCEENHDTDNETHDDDDECITEILADTMRGEAKQKLSRRLKIARRQLRRRRTCWKVFVGLGSVRIIFIQGVSLVRTFSNA